MADVVETPVLVVADSETTAQAAMYDRDLDPGRCRVVMSLEGAARHIGGTRGRGYLLALHPHTCPTWLPVVLGMLTACEAVRLD